MSQLKQNFFTYQIFFRVGLKIIIIVNKYTFSVVRLALSHSTVHLGRVNLFLSSHVKIKFKQKFSVGMRAFIGIDPKVLKETGHLAEEGVLWDICRKVICIMSSFRRVLYQTHCNNTLKVGGVSHRSHDDGLWFCVS